MESLDDMKASIGKAKRLCLFGAGALLNDCLPQFMFSLGRIPDFLCDNSQEKWGKKFFGMDCISPSELAKMREGMVVVITVKNYEGILLQLNSLGIKDVFIALYGRGYSVLQDIKRADSELVDGSVPSPISVKGKWTLITGASRGVGRLIALEMSKLGSNIIAHSRSLSHSKAIAQECASLGVQVTPVAAELGNSDELESMLSSLEHLAPQVDIVFNNAGISACCPSNFWTTPCQNYADGYAVNTIAPIHICQKLIPGMLRRGFGRVVNTSSSIEKSPENMAYACSKAALNKFVYDLAPSLKGSGVMISIVDPGWLRTDMGGAKAPHAPESVIPGALLGALIDGNVNGCWFSAQDYAGLSLESAIQKAKFICVPADFSSKKQTGK